MKFHISAEKWKNIVKSTDVGVPVVLTKRNGECGIIVPPHRFVRTICVDCCGCTDRFYCCGCTPAPFVPHGTGLVGCKCLDRNATTTVKEDKGGVLVLTWRASPRNKKNMEEIWNNGTPIVISRDEPEFPCNESNSPVVMTSGKKAASIMCVNCREVLGTTGHLCPNSPESKELLTETKELVKDISKEVVKMMKKMQDIEERLPRYETRSKRFKP